MSWDRVSCGFDIEEESRNFGTRAAALGEDAIFESSTLAVIESSNPGNLNERPRCLSKYHPSGFAVVLDTSIIIFNENLSQLLFSLDFGNTIEDIEWTQDGSFIYIGLQTGALFAIHVQTEILMRISKNLDSSLEGSFYAKIKSYCTETCFDIIVVTTVGKIIRINGTNRKDIEDCCNSTEESSIKKKEVSKIISQSLKFNVHHSPPFRLNNSVKVVEDSYPSISGNLIIFSGDTIQVWNKSDNFTFNASYPSSVSSNQLLQAFISPDHHFIICLLKTGAILYINKYTYEFIYVNNDLNIVNYSFIISGVRGADCKMLLHTKNPDQDLCLLSYPDLKLYFRLADTSDIVLPMGLDDHLYYIEFFGEDFVNTVKIKTIVENEPRLRLERLLQRGKFDQAEEFAKCFNLPMDQVNQSKAKHTADDISVWHQGNFSEIEIENLFEKLIGILNEINDLKFVVDLCKSCVPCKMEFIDKLLKYALGRLDKVASQESVLYVKYYEEMSILNKLFRTFSELNNISHSPIAWAEFSSSNFLKDCQNYIAKGDVKSAAILCRGHWSELSAGMTPELGITLLNLLPLYIPKSDILFWFHRYIPLYLHLHEDTLRFFTQWTVDTIDEMACIQRDIETCRDLANEILKILHNSFNECSYIPCNFFPLVNYLNDRTALLEQLIYIKREHNIIIPFQQMTSKEEKVSYIIRTLENVPINCINIFMEQFVISFCSAHSLRSDEIILNCIKSSKVIRFSKDEWEVRCIKLTNLIFNETEKMEAVLYILRQASIPWSSTISEFETLSSKTSDLFYKEEIFNIKKTSIIQTLLLKNGLPRYALNNINYRRISSIIKFINYNSQNETDFFNDMKLLTNVENSTMFKTYCASLCRSLSEGHLKDKLKSIEQESKEDKEVVTNLHVWCANLLDQIPPFTCVNENSSKCNYNEDEVDIVSTWINYYKLPEKRLAFNYPHIMKWLQINFGVNLAINQLYSFKSRTELVKKCIYMLLENYRDKLPENTDVLPYFTDKMRKLALKVDMPLWLVHFELAFEAINSDEIEIAVQSMRCLTVENAGGTIPDNKLCELAKNIFRNHKDNPLDYIDLYKQLAILMKTHNYCDTGNVLPDEKEIYNIMIEFMCKDNFEKPTWYASRLYVDKKPYLSYQSDISFQELSLLRNLLIEGSVSLENNTEVNEHFLSELLKKIPDSIHSIALSLRLQLAFEVRLLLSEKELSRIKSIITRMVSNILLKVVSSDSFDLFTALSLLNYFPQQHALKWIDNVLFKTELLKLHNLCHLALVYCSKEFPDKFKDFAKIFTTTIWERTFQNVGLSFQNIFVDDNIKISTLKSLIKLPDFNCTILENYCISFSCDIQQYFLIYLSQLLLTWKLDFTSDDELIFAQTYEDFYEKCRNVAIKVNGNDLTHFILKDIWNKVNPYYYEVFSVIINLINEMGENEKVNFADYEFLLNFLISYKRISSPGEIEKEMWILLSNDDDSECYVFERLSQYRLPFNSLPANKLWDFIKLEFTLDTYQQWLAVPSWFGVELLNDNICIQAIRNMEGCYRNKTWDLQEKRKDVMSKIEKCVSHMRSHEFKTTALYFVVNHVMPAGADQVEAAQHCLFKALDWKNTDDSCLSRECYIRAEKKYLSVHTKHTLIKYNLAKGEYLNIANQPVELIKALYHDSSVVDDFTKTGINEACATIAELFKKPTMLTDIKKELLYKWFSNNCNQSSNDSMVEVNYIEENKNNFEILKRATYTLMGEDKTFSCNFLMSIIFSQGDHSKHVLMKLRALQVLLSIVPHSELSSITGKTLSDLENLQFVYELERVGVSISVNGFKEKIDKNLLFDLLLNPTIQKCIIAAKIADSYSIQCKDVWNKILEILTSFNLLNELKKYLVKLSKWSVLNRRVVVNAWNTLLMTYALKANFTEYEKEDFINLFSNCPVLNVIDLSNMSPEILELLKR